MTNTVLHAISCLLAAKIILLCFGNRRLPAFSASMLFALHPVHVEVVANLTGRAETLSSCFMLASLLCFDRSLQLSRRSARRIAPQLAWLAAAYVFVVVGALSKETAIVTPALFVAYVVWFLGFLVVLSCTLRRTPKRLTTALLLCAYACAVLSLCRFFAECCSRYELAVAEVADTSAAAGSATLFARGVGLRLQAGVRSPRVWATCAFALGLLWVRVFLVAGGYQFDHAECVRQDFVGVPALDVPISQCGTDVCLDVRVCA